MNRPRFRIAAIAATVALVVPAAAWADFDDNVARNDRAHFRAPASPAAERPHAAASPGASSQPVVVRVDQGFDWSSAGVGAAGGLGLALVAGGAFSLVRNRPRLPGTRPDLI